MFIKKIMLLRHRAYLSKILPKKPVKLFLLDRDGVINIDLPHGVHTIDEFQLIPDAAVAIKLINQAGIPVVLITNQALVGRHEITEQQLGAIHDHMRKLLQAHGAHIDKIYYCTDTAIEPHNRRKPAPGMINEALADFNVSPQDAVMIGDAIRDLQAAVHANCQRALVRTGKGTQTSKENLTAIKPLEIYDDLYQAVQSIMANTLTTS